MRAKFWCAYILLALLAESALAADTNSPPMSPQDFFEGGPTTYNNWVELTTGDFMTRGNAAQAQAMQNWNNGVFGGIEDLHLQDNVNFLTNTTLTVDGHSIYDQHDYNITARLEHQDKWFLQFHADNYRTWSDGLGGYYPSTGTQYYGPKNNDALALDRGEYSVLGGLTLDNLPALTFQYTHSYRDGNEDSTIWGPVHPDLLNSPGLSQGLVPSLYDFDERIDAFDLNAKKTLWSTDFGLGLHYEHGDLNDGLETEFYPGEIEQSDRTMSDLNTYNLFSATATGEKWIKQHVFISAGGMVANLDSTFSGSQIYGDDFGMPYSPGIANGYGYYNMNGSSHLQEYVMDLNLLTIPFKSFDIIPAVRAEKDSWGGNSSGVGTLSTFPTEDFDSQSSRDVIDVCENLDARYTGLTNWVVSAGGQWDETDGNLNQQGGLTQVNGIGPVPVVNYTDDNSLLQKYSADASWYPLARLALDFGGYYKNDRYNYSTSGISTDDGDTYPGNFIEQGYQMFDGNCRVTVHLLRSLTSISQYEYQLSTIDTTPDPASGISEMQTSRMRSHVIGENVSWVPWSRLSLDAGLSYVLSVTKTPTSEDTASDTAGVLNAENNYWTLNFSSTLVLDDKTDLTLGYFYYDTADYQNYSPAGVPLDAGSREHAASATLTRQINPRLRVSLKYSYYNYEDALTGGNGNFEAHLIMASMQFRF